MLARDRQTNQFKKVYVKALDSMPVGSEIDFDGQASDIPVGWEESTNPDSYSTDEVKTNKTWIDNKPIYRKVYTGTADIQATSSSTQLFSIDSDINIVKMDGYYKWASFQQFFPFVWGTATVGLRRVSNSIHYYASAGIGPGNYTVILEYTKTTD